MHYKKLELVGLLLFILIISLSCGKNSKNPTGTDTDSHKKLSVYTVNNGLTNNEVTALILDHEGKLWCGTAAGLTYFDGTSWREQLNEFGESLPYINSIAFTPEGVMWINAADVRFDGQWLQAKLLRYDGNEWITQIHVDELPNLGIEAMAVDVYGTVWFGLGYGGVFWFDGETWDGYDPGEGGHIYSISLNQNGEVWVGTWGGLLKYNGSSWEIFTHTDGLPSNWVNCTAIDLDGNLWFGTYHYGDDQAGISFFDGTTVKTYSTVDGLINNYVTSVAIDNDNNIWIGTSEGVSMFDGLLWTSLTLSEDIFSNYVTSIVVDKENCVWIGSKNGLFRYE